VVAVVVVVVGVVGRGGAARGRGRGRGRGHEAEAAAAAAEPRSAAPNSVDTALKALLTDEALEVGVRLACAGRYERALTNQLLAWLAKELEREGSPLHLQPPLLLEKKTLNAARTIARSWYFARTDS